MPSPSGRTGTGVGLGTIYHSLRRATIQLAPCLSGPAFGTNQMDWAASADALAVSANAS